MKTKWSAFILVLTFLVSACGAQRVEQLTERTKKYNRAIRWSSVSAASTMMAPDVRRKLAGQLANHLSKGNVVEFAVIDLGVNKEKTEASVLVEYSFYRNIDQTLRYRQELQSWKFDKDEKEWFLHEARLMASK